MTDREKLIEIVRNSLKKNIGKSCKLAESIVDDIIGAGVIVPPVKVGDFVYEIYGKEITVLRISRITIFKNSIEMCCHIEEDYCRYFTETDIGSTIFLTIDEAKKALEEREDNG